MANTHFTNTFDAAQQPQDAGLVAASAAGTRIIDTGPGIGKRWFKAVIDTTALEIASTDEAYTIHMQGSPDAGFGTAGNIVELASLHLGAKATKLSDCDRDDTTGRREIGFVNTTEEGTPLRYIRAYITVAGNVATGINLSIRLVPLDIKA